jgi:hypothetical protein
MAGASKAGRFRGSPRATDSPASPDVTLTLSGQTATFTGGTIAQTVAYGLTAQTATFTEGAPTLTASYALSAQTSTFTEGSLSVSLTYALSGQTSTFAQGTITAVPTYGLTAQSATFTQGSLAPAIDYSLTGQSATFTEGTISATQGGDVTLSLTGQTATFAEGALAASLAYALSGQSATFSEGTISRALAYALTSQTATFSEGTITAEAGGDVTIQLSGLQALFSVGQISANGGDAASAFGGGFLYAYELEQSRRRKKRREQEDLEEDAEALKDQMDREIALLLRKQEAEDERRAELDRLQRLVRDHSRNALELSDRAKIAYVRALTQANFSAMEALDRELQRMLEEEEITALMILLNED